MAGEAWAEEVARLASAIGGGGQARAAARLFAEQALYLRFGKARFAELDIRSKLTAVDMLHSTMDVLDGLGDRAFDTSLRTLIQLAFFRHWEEEPKGPAWRMSPAEESRPTYQDWLMRVDFA